MFANVMTLKRYIGQNGQRSLESPDLHRLNRDCFSDKIWTDSSAGLPRLCFCFRQGATQKPPLFHQLWAQPLVRNKTLVTVNRNMGSHAVLSPTSL